MSGSLSQPFPSPPASCPAGIPQHTKRRVLMTWVWAHPFPCFCIIGNWLSSLVCSWSRCNAWWLLEARFSCIFGGSRREGRGEAGERARWKRHMCGRLSQASCLLVSELVHLKLALEVNPESLFSKQRSKLFIHSLCFQCSIHGGLYPLHHLP